MRASSPSVVAERAEENFRRDQRRLHEGTDRLMVALLLVQWFGAVVTALVVSPRAWAGETSQVHIHVWAAVMLGGMLALFPAWMVRRARGAAITRHTIAAAQMAFSALLIHLGGGRIEWHFHVFGSLAFLAVYRDWRVLLTATVLVAGDHIVRGVWWPRSVFGVLAASHWRWVEHAAWVVFEDSVLVVTILRAVSEARAHALAQAQLQSAMEEVEERVRDRTRELQLATVRAETANKAKSEFLANMSHEIRTPMTAIVGFAEVLEDPGLSASDRLNHLQTIRRSGKHLIAIINDILDLSKIEAGRLSVAKTECDVALLLHDVVAERRGTAEATGLWLRLRFETGLPERIETDPLRLRQILVNLLGNAVKFTHEGGVDVVVAMEDGVKGSWLRVDVIDTGIGIAAADHEKLFRAFSQVDTSGTRRYGGTGLGLAISARLAEMLGGGIEVASREGEGSRFTLRVAMGDVPGVRERSVEELARVGEALVVVPEEGEASATIAPGASGGGPCASRPSARPCDGIRVLLAEDGPDNQRLIGFHLRKAGARLDVVGNGRLAVDRAMDAEGDGSAYDVILMDMQMPVLDGYGAVEELRSRGYTGPIVALTAHAMSGDRERCLEAGCNGYETKPVSGARLIKTVLEWSGARRAA